VSPDGAPVFGVILRAISARQSAEKPINLR
jgi:hypothetical protein